MDQAKLIETLRIPELKSGTLALELAPKALQEWRDGLPLGNLQATTRQVFTLLREANRLELPEKGRLLLLDALGPQIDYISGALTKGAQGHAHPLPDKVTKLVQLNQELLAEAAIGYKIIARGLLGKRFVFGVGAQRKMVTALQAVLHYFGRIVLESYRTYVPFPEGLWGEIHATYAIAEARKIDQEKSEDFSEGWRMTLSDSYKRLMLIALASPYQFERGTIDLLYQRLSEWSEACHLTPLGHAPGDELHIVIRLDGSTPPSFKALEGDDVAESDQVRLLDAAPLTAILQDEIELLKNGPSKPQRTDDMPHLPIITLQILLENWSGPTTRAETRYQGQVQVQVAIGLNAACYFLTHGHGSTAELAGPGTEFEIPEDVHELSLEVAERAVDFEQQGLVSVQEQKRDKIADMLLPQAAAAAWTENRSAEPPRSYACQTQDFSASGCQLVCAKESKLTISVGDLLCIGFDDTQSARWKIGTARWIRQRSGQDTQVGVRILANEGRGVKAGVCDETGYVSDISDCILLPGKDGVTLLTPRMPFALDKMVYMLDEDDQEHFIRLGENVETSSRFGRFEFRPCTEREIGRIQDERNKPVARLSKKQLEAMARGESVDKILEDDSGAWDGMRHDW